MSLGQAGIRDRDICSIDLNVFSISIVCTFLPKNIESEERFAFSNADIEFHIKKGKGG
jgi:hypothetical protein